MREQIMQQAEDANSRRDAPGTFVNYILLKDVKWDKEALREELKNEWDIEDDPDDEDEA